MAFGKYIADHPLHMQTLARMEVYIYWHYSPGHCFQDITTPTYLLCHLSTHLINCLHIFVHIHCSAKILWILLYIQTHTPHIPAHMLIPENTHTTPPTHTPTYYTPHHPHTPIPTHTYTHTHTPHTYTPMHPSTHPFSHPPTLTHTPHTHTQVETRGCLLFTLDVCRLLGLEECGLATTSDKHLLRILTPILKLYTAKQVGRDS